MPDHTILILDDDGDVRESLALALWKSPYRLRFAASAEGAFAILASERVDVVVADHLMPGVTGLDFLRVVHDRWPDVTRIMLTGHATADLAMAATNDCEVFRVLAKPIDRDALMVVLHLACERADVERESRRLLALVRNTGIAELEAKPAPPARTLVHHH